MQPISAPRIMLQHHGQLTHFPQLYYAEWPENSKASYILLSCRGKQPREMPKIVWHNAQLSIK